MIVNRSIINVRRSICSEYIMFFFHRNITRQITDFWRCEVRLQIFGLVICPVKAHQRGITQSSFLKNEWDFWKQRLSWTIGIVSTKNYTRNLDCSSFRKFRTNWERWDRFFYKFKFKKCLFEKRHFRREKVQKSSNSLSLELRNGNQNLNDNHINESNLNELPWKLQ